MRVVVVTPPAPVVSLDEAKAHLRVDGDDDDLLVSGLIAAATRGLDGPDGWLGRALGAQTLRAFVEPEDHLACYGRGGFDLPYPPTRTQDAMAVTTVTPGSGPDLSPSYYRLDGSGRRLSFDMGALQWGVSTAITYTTGTAIPDGQETAPIADEVRCAILLLAGGLYANREADVIDARAVVAANPAVERLLAPLRVWRL